MSLNRPAAPRNIFLIWHFFFFTTRSSFYITEDIPLGIRFRSNVVWQQECPLCQIINLVAEDGGPAVQVRYGAWKSFSLIQKERDLRHYIEVRCPHSVTIRAITLICRIRAEGLRRNSRIAVARTPLRRWLPILIERFLFVHEHKTGSVSRSLLKSWFVRRTRLSCSPVRFDHYASFQIL